MFTDYGENLHSLMKTKQKIHIGSFKVYLIVGKKLRTISNSCIFYSDSPSVSILPYPLSSLCKPYVSLSNCVGNAL